MNGKLTRNPIFQRMYKPVQHGEMIYMPKGLQFLDREPDDEHREHLFSVDARLCHLLESHRLDLLSLWGKKGYLDIAHFDDEVAFWIDEFQWHPRLGVIVRGQWTEDGLRAAETYRYLSIHGRERAIIGKIGELAPPSDSQNFGGLCYSTKLYCAPQVNTLPRLPELSTSTEARPRTLGDLVGGVKKRTT